MSEKNKKTEEQNEELIPKVNLKIKSLEAITSKEHLSDEELIAIDNARIQRGQELADKIFELANQVRTKDLNTYIEAIQDAVRGKPSEENQAILRTACSFFRDKYRKWCRDRGKSVELIDNITHRTGKQSEAILAKVLHGFDVIALSRELWGLDITKQYAKLREARQQLYDLTNDQINEIREEYNTIPSQEQAEVIHFSINATNMADEPQPDVDAIKYILKGRSLTEVKQIEFQFNEKYHFTHDDKSEPLLREQLEAKLSKEDFESIEVLLKGFSSEKTADEIHDLLIHCSEASEIYHSNINLHPDFAGNFRRDYSKASNVERELRAREELDTLIKYLTPAQFDEVNQVLNKKYGEHLTPELYSCNMPFNPRKKALELYRAFQHVKQRRLCRKEQDYLDYSKLLYIKSKFSTSTHNEITAIINKWAYEQKSIESYELIKQAISPIEYLTPDQLFYVKEWFYICVGKKLRDYVEERVNFICRNEVPKYVAIILKNRMAGTSRLPLKADLFDLFPSAEQRKQNYLNLEPLAAQLAQAKEDAKVIQQFIDEFEEKQNSEEILSFLRMQDRDRSNAMEKAFLELSNGISLIDTIRAKISNKETQTTAILLLSQFDVKKEAEKLHNNPEALLELLSQTPKAVTFVLQEYNEIYGTDLLSLVQERYSNDPDKLMLLSTVLFTPNVLRLHKIFKQPRPLNDEELDYLITQLTRPRGDVLAFEASYNHYFARYEDCQDEIFGSLLQQLRIYATYEYIPRKYFASAILLLENVDPSIPLTMQNHLEVKEIGGAAIIKLHGLLREFKQHLSILQKAYNALNEEKTLRETIYDLKIPLEVKNKTILLLDGFDPDAVAYEIISVMEGNLSGEALGQKILTIIAEPQKGKPNPRIPQPMNWIGEMYHQIRVSYEAQTGRKMVSDLIKKGVPMQGFGINAISYKLYGEVSKKVFDIRKLISKKGTSEDKLDIIDRKIVQTLADLLPALRERVMNMYDAYYADAGGSLSLLGEIKSIKNEIISQNGQNLIQECLTWDIPQESTEEKEESSDGDEDLTFDE